MRLLRKISAIICLGIIGALTLHNIVPHIHHSHIEFEEVVNSNEHHHSHDNDGHHSGDQNSNSTEQDFLLIPLIDNHSHSFHTHEFVLRSKSSVTYSISKQLIVAVIADNYGSPPEHEIQTLLKYALLKQVFIDAPTLLNYSLRGPPSLG